MAVLSEKRKVSLMAGLSAGMRVVTRDERWAALLAYK